MSGGRREIDLKTPRATRANRKEQNFSRRRGVNLFIYHWNSLFHFIRKLLRWGSTGGKLLAELKYVQRFE